MDRLLRRHARPGGGGVRAATNAGAHMDADEMNAYAEGALPEAARSRYFAHLADCDACRKLVTKLTLAASAADEGRARAAAAVTAAPSKSWRERLAAIFSPPVLRYAVPALALFAVVIVALVALRANRDASQVALREQSAPNAGSSVGANTSSAVQPTTSAESGENHAAGNTDTTTVYNEPTGPQLPTPAATPTPLLAEKAPADKAGAPAGQATQPEQPVARTDDDKAASREDRAQAGGKRAEEEVAAAPPPPPRPAQEPVLAAPSTADKSSARDNEDERRAKAEGKDDSNNVTTDGVVVTEAQPNRGRGELGKAAGGAPASSTRSRTSVARKNAPPADRPARNERSAG
ncbi:MAG TPA: zf-HC2 domain-containing protein, partial [Pyrinomonadaceae bacterium]|nr:zf-HC2 domain-containing protein [Pyrinomonadaceae bacterium]